MKEKTKKVLLWMFVAFCFTAVLVYGLNLGSILILLCGIAAMPIEPVRNLWKKLLPDKLKWAKKASIAILFFVAVMCLPTVETDVPDNTTVQTEQGDNQKEDLVSEKEDSKEESEIEEVPDNLKQSEVDLSAVADYSSEPYVELSGNLPSFSVEELVEKSFEKYSELDNLGRCGVAYACIGKDIMPTEERGSIGQVKPSGWHLVKYDVVDGNYLYNRCHLIGYQLAGENANTKNLITGTRYLNVEGMLPFENKVADYVEKTGNHVLYRVTPFFEGDNLLANGVQIEAYSVEDKGEGICFNVYVYNVQPGVTIDYATGESKLTDTGSAGTDVSITIVGSGNSETPEDTTPSNDANNSNNSSSNVGASQTPDVQEPADSTMVWKSATGSKYHCVNDCGNMNPSKAKQLTKEEAEAQGLEPCSKCY